MALDFGQTPLVVAAALGHESPSTTLGNYAAPGAGDAARQARVVAILDCAAAPRNAQRNEKGRSDRFDPLVEIERLWGAKRGSPDADQLEVLVTLVNAYEAKHHAIAPPDPIEAILFRMEQAGKSRADLVPILGSRARVSEVLNRQRPLTLAMIRRLRSVLGISAGCAHRTGTRRTHLTASFQSIDRREIGLPARSDHDQARRLAAAGQEREELHRRAVGPVVRRQEK